MKWSQLKLRTLRESPSESTLKSYSLLTRGAYLKKLSSGIYTYGPFMLRAIKKLEHIIRKELNQAGFAEILMPVVQSKNLWEKSGRWSHFNHLLQKFESRTGMAFCLGPTHEEVVTEYAKDHIKSHKDLPLLLFQIQNKYRDEIRPRFGLLRAKEFIMKDAYSFDENVSSAENSYQKMKQVYLNIFRQVGVPFAVVRADSGDIGGSQSEEFHILAPKGEDTLLIGQDFASNKEICPAPLVPKKHWKTGDKIKELHTPNGKTIKELSKIPEIKKENLVKTLLLKITPSDPKQKNSPKTQIIAVLLKGNDEINLIKVKNALGLSALPTFLEPKAVREWSKGGIGYVGPVGLSCPVYLDQSLYSLEYFITGANKENYHLNHVLPERDFPYKKAGDFIYAKPGDKTPKGKGTLKQIRGIEVGHIFYLGNKYSKAMSLEYLNKEGKQKFPEMGCYGIGVTRTLQAVVECSHDKDGIIWPLTIAPFLVHICVLDPKDNQTRLRAEELYNNLNQQGVDCFMDDRLERPGVKFKDADLLGLPFRVTVGARDGGLMEFTWRKTSSQKQKRTLREISAHIISLMKKETTSGNK